MQTNLPDTPILIHPSGKKLIVDGGIRFILGLAIFIGMFRVRKDMPEGVFRTFLLMIELFIWSPFVVSVYLFFKAKKTESLNSIDG